MNPAQARQLIKDTFTHPFDRDRFRLFAVNVLNRMDESKKGNMQVPDAFAAHVKSCQRLATYTDPQGELMDVLVVHTTEDWKIERTRTALRDFVAHKLKRGENYKEAGLVAFVTPDAARWRLSYVRMQYESVRDPKTGLIKPEEKVTPARRFSYLVGEGESCHTAQTRFLDLLQDTSTDPALAQIEEAFSVEAVTKEFFAKYAELFGDINAALEKMVAKDKTLRDEFAAKGVNTVDFAKKLLGQIVFLYFLQKKGWLGVERGKDWGTGPRDFLRRLVDRSDQSDPPDPPNIFNDILEPLFYDTLATDRGHEAWRPRFKCRIPFLNGGLFEPLNGYDWKKTDILIPNRLFTNNDPVEEGITGTGVLDVFDRYNFTVNEAEPLEKEVAIDPEMLGKVFENLIEENRRKGLGAFYTPREIVHYMCQESLINYLETSVPAVPRADLETFVRLGDQIAHYEAVETAYKIRMPKSIEQNARALDDALKTITVCDPAVGSGAFPVGMMTEIVRCRMALNPFFDQVDPSDPSARTPYHFKRDAIQNCLYGVDIDSSAVEIAKLRLWLSLVVDEEDPASGAGVKQVKPLPNLDYKIVVGNSLLGVEKDLFNQDAFQKLEKLKTRFFDQSDQSEKSDLRRQINALIHDLTHGHETFDFEIFFSEVFHQKGGFDVVIANPPYVSVEKFARTSQQTEWKRRFKTFAARGDIYCFFYERGLGLLRDDGVLTFISSNKFQRAGYGKGLRQLLASQRIRALVDFCELPVFAAATDPMIVVVNKGAPAKNHEIPVVVIKDEAEFETLHQSLATRGNLYKPEQLKADGWSLEGGDGLALVDKLWSKGTPLGDYVKGRFYRGVLTGLNEAFVIDRATRDRLIREDRKSAELIKPWIRGKDIRRWQYEWHDLYLLQIESSENVSHPWTGKSENVAWRIFEADYPAIAKHLSDFDEELRKRTDQGTYFWELRSCDYWDAFAHPKVVFNETSKELHAYLDTEKNIINKTGFIILSPDAPYILTILNSTSMDWLYRSTFPSWGDPWNSGRVQFRGNLMAKVPIPPASSADKVRLTKLAERAAKQAGAGDAAGLRATEREIDEIVYRLFDLTPDEIAHIEQSLAVVRAAGGEEDGGETDD